MHWRSGWFDFLTQQTRFSVIPDSIFSVIPDLIR